MEERRKSKTQEWYRGAFLRKSHNRARRILCRSFVSLLRQSTEIIDRRGRPERTIDLKIETTFSGRETSRQFTTEPGQSAPRFEIQIGMRNRNRADGISALFRVSRFGDGGVAETAREKRPKEWKDVGAEKPRDVGGEGHEEGARSRARVSLNLNLRFAGPPLVSLVFILSRDPCVPVARCFPKSNDRESCRFSRHF